MKVKVSIKVHSKAGDKEQSTFDVVAFVADTVATLKERILSIQCVPFPEQQLVLDGKVLDDHSKLAECGITEGAKLDFVVHVSETTIVKQLSELLQSKPVAAQELALLYTHEHGASLDESLAMVGYSGSVSDFLTRHSKQFAVIDGLVCPPAVNAKLRVAVQSMAASWASFDDEEALPLTEISIRPEETIAAIAARVATAAGVPSAYADVQLSLAGRNLSAESTAAAEGLVGLGAHVKLIPRTSESSLTRQLLKLLDEQGEMPLGELALLYSCRHGANADLIAAEVLGASRRNLADFLRARPALFALNNGRAARAPARAAAPEDASASTAHERALSWHDKACSRQFRAEVARALGVVIAYITEVTFLSVQRAVAGGAAGKGTAVPGAADAEVTLVVEGLPKTFEGLQGLLEATCSGLQERLADDPTAPAGLRVVGVQDGAVQLEAAGLTSLKLRLSPAFATHGEALKAVKAGADVLPAGVLAACLAEQEVRFIKKQPEAIKATMRLLKLWRGKQAWSSEKSRPSDRLLELLALRAAADVPAGSYDQGLALEAAAALLQTIGAAEVTWPAPLYGSFRISDDIRTQRPLIMDPVNPFANLAPFDAAEISRMAEGSLLETTN